MSTQQLNQKQTLSDQQPKSSKKVLNLNKVEMKRLKKMRKPEEEVRKQGPGHQVIAGIDEAGRGPLAGPVVAAACILPQDAWIAGVNDSKQLTAEKRAEIFANIIACPGVYYGVGIVSPEEIDQINIYQATIRAMLKAVELLKIIPHYLIVDGMSLPHPTIPSQRLIAGDALCYSVAAASILAKVTRDRLMLEFHLQWPQYGFDQHKGYGTEKHRAAIAEHGPCPIHRMSFEPLKKKEIVEEVLLSSSQ